MSPGRRDLGAVTIAASPVVVLLAIEALAIGWPGGASSSAAGARAADAFAWCFAEAVFLTFWAPAVALRCQARLCEGTGLRNGIALPFGLAGAVIALHALVLVLARVPASKALLVQAILLAYGAALFGVGILAGRGGGRTSPAIAAVAVTGLALAVTFSPLWLNPFLEHPTLDEHRPAVVRGALGSSPLANVAGVLEHDWLREDLMYRTSVVGPYYPFAYPKPSGFLAVAVALTALGAFGMVRIGTRSAERAP